jgi:glycosyltransferase involved in cell wall biosynthesis
MILISAIICTYNRSKLLMGALESLAQQSLDPRCYEIIVVDNASTDETPETVRAFQGKHPGHTTVLVYEPQQGLGYARNTGLRHARGKYAAYLDDDARANPDWLKNAIELFETVKPTPICIGGPVLPFYETPKPEWFKDDYETKTHGDKPRCLCRDEAFSGSNMAWRKESAESLGGFEVSLGVKGSLLNLGEETALFDRVWRSFDHPVLYYSPRLSVHHLITSYQMTISYRLKWEFVHGQVWNWIYGPTVFWSRLLLLARLLWGIAKLGSLALWRGRAHAYWQSWLIEEWKPVTRKIGILFGILRLSVPVRRREE